ncbi:nucleobase:cation symporter-2 family protein [Niameybacter massiliensis]|uniref:Nucleobase:cation symporter-2 family protein n=1 Tax=Holtiella tumoricola TaxID=3018743 RepID=A0AA42DKC8_9FIRM|nr:MULTISPECIES: nucleobase:cation symporter-2 family protein [Lachnospirales]MDA3730435.1 nucleobase:cation symporter-2 family protein [Holtiella tumoricola]
MKASKEEDRNLIYQLEGRPSLSVAVPLGLQHVLAMFAGNLAPIFIVAGIAGVSMQERVLMIQCAMLVSGLATFIQLYPIKLGKNLQIGANLPIVMGTAFAFVPTLSTIAASYGIQAVFGGILVGAFVEIIMGLLIKPAKNIFSPVIIGAVLVTIGIKLLGIGANYFAGGVGASDFGSLENLFLGSLVFLIVIVLQRYGKGFFKVTALLIGLVVGFIVALMMGKVDLTPVMEASWFTIPMPLYFKPEFRLDAIMAFAAVYIVSGLETLGNTSGITMAAFNREATPSENQGAILADAIGSQVAGLFNCLPNTAFGQNAGIVAMTKVVNKFCIAMGAAVLILASIVPKVGAVFAAMPSSVLGGAVITVFAMILINGFKMLAKAGFTEKNVLILSVTFAIGYGLTALPEVTAHFHPFLQFIFSDAVASVCIVGIIANIFLNLLSHKKG